MISIIIPAFNRTGPLRDTLRSARAALPDDGEIILVDDGSTPPLAEQLSADDLRKVHLIRQDNQGSMIARLTGLDQARNPHILFLDSDDLIHPDKIRLQIAAMDEAGADISISDMAEVRLDGGSQVFLPAERLLPPQDSDTLFMRRTVAPHNPIYKRDYLLSALQQPRLAPRRIYDPVGDVWIFYNLLGHPAKLAYVPLPLTAAGIHDEIRYSSHWETLGLAALFLMEDFLAACPDPVADAVQRSWVGISAFLSWRALPKDFVAGYRNRTLNIWRHAGRPSHPDLGGSSFHGLSRLIGRERAAKLLLQFRGQPYADCRSLDDAGLEKLIQALSSKPAPF